MSDVFPWNEKTDTLRMIERFVAVLALVLWTVSAAAAPTLTTFTIDASAPGASAGSFDLAAGNLGIGDAANFAAVSAGGAGFTYQYVSQSFTPSVSGSYTFGMAASAFDGVLLIYTGSFNPASPPTNLFYANDDSDGLGAGGVVIVGCPAPALCPKTTQSLTAGTTYQIVVTSFSPSPLVAYPVDFYVFGEPVVVGGAAVRPVPTLSTWGMLIMASLMMLGAVATRRNRV